MPSIKLPRQIVNQLMLHAQHNDKNEVCGLISQNTDQEMTLYPMKNIATDPAHYFQMDGPQMIRTMKSIREEGAELFAIYHSHPSTPATPSKTDIEKAGYPDALYLIISLNTKGVIELKGYKIQQDSTTSIDLII